VVWLAVGVLVIRGTGNRKVNVQNEDERKEVILPHRKVGSAGECKRAKGEVYLQGRNIKLQVGQLDEPKERRD